MRALVPAWASSSGCVTSRNSPSVRKYLSVMSRQVFCAQRRLIY